MQLGIPIPKLLGIFCSNSTGLQIGVGPLYGEEQWIKFFDARCPAKFVVKPSHGAYGNDILFVDKTNPLFSPSSLYRQLLRNARHSSFVIQECLENHPDLQLINHKQGLQTFRIITLAMTHNDIGILYAFFKPITGANLIDNHRDGETLNLLCPVEVSTGILQELYIVGKTSVLTPDRHPDTNRCLKGSLVPQWSDILNHAKAAARAFLPLRCIGWDIALGKNGVSVIEANSRWDPLLFGNIHVVMKPIRELLGISPPVHEERFSSITPNAS
jgi:hypothetical protein